MPVGELFLSAFIAVLFEKLTSPQLLNFATQEGVRSKLKKWEKTLKMIEAMLIDAEDKQLTDEAVKMWLDDLQDLAYDADDILDQFSTQALRTKLNQHATTSKPRKLNNIIPACFTGLTPSSFKFNFSMGSKIDNITRRLEELRQRTDVLRLKDIAGQRYGSSTASWQRPPTSSLPTEPAVYGRDEDKARILEMVLRINEPSDANFGVIPIVGMGGIGKTTLAREVFNDETLKDFNPKAWVCVSDNFDVLKISKAILESITSSSCDLKELNAVQIQLKETINGKKFLFVLDDVWSQNYDLWETLKSPFMFGALGSKVIVTTRHRQVASTMRPNGCYKLGLLSDEDCRSVFVKHALEGRDNVTDGNLEVIYQKVVEKCKGLPLAARTLGGLLRSKQIEGEWMNILNNKIWDLPVEGNILPVLKLSYYHLPSHLKRCFAYYAIFPKDYEFREQELVFLWMAEGLIQQSQDNHQLEDLGGEYFRDLLSRSIFQSSNINSSKFVMHDLVNDLAQSVSGKLSFRLEDEMGFSNQSKLFDRTRYSSYICHECNCKGGFEVFNNAEHLRTFLPLPPINDRVSTYYISNTVVFDLLMKFKKLRVLSLRKHYIVELPNSLGGLRLLRYLNLSDTKIRSLPKSINSMSNLQTLILRNCCRLLKLPSDFGNLINLRHLDIFGATLIAGMPLGMGNLRCLRTLSNFIVGKSFGSSLKDLKHLQFLCGELRVSRLDNVNDFQGTREVILSDKKDLKMLLLEWSSKFDDLRDEQAEENLLDKLQPHENLKELTIRCYAGKKFPSWFGDSSLIFNMVVIRLEGCEKCTSLPSLGQLGSLKNLTIKGMKAITSIGSEFYGEGCSYPFKSLETLYFEDLQEWERWILVEEENERARSFPNLRDLSIVRCPRLAKSLPNNLSLLEKLVIRKCPELVLEFSSIPLLCKLEIDGCKRFVCRCPTRCKSLTSMSLSNISDFGNLLRQEFQEVECLNIKGCEELIHLWQTNICLERPRRGLHSLTSLKELYIGSCGTLTSLSKEIKLSIAHLEKLQIEDCHSLTFVFRAQLPPSLKRLDVRNCEKLMCLFDDENEDNSSTCSSTSSLILNENVNNTSTSLLEYLVIEKCPSLTCLSTTGELPATLTSLLIKDCSKLVTLSSIGQLPTQLKDLEIKKCSELKTILSEGHLPETLETLNIKICPKLEFIVERFLNNRALNDIRISNCTKLKAIPEGLHTLSSLRIFYIWDCPSLDLLIEGGFPNTNLSVWLILCKTLKGLPSSLHNLTSLQGLFLYGCPRIPFPEEGFPTNLASLSIEGLNLYKPLSEWGLHKLTSLRYLHIWGCLDAVSFPEENMQMGLPTTLTELWITSFPKLKYLSSKGFQNLTSLEFLLIDDCPNLTSLPNLPSSLLRLYIEDCPLLKKHCKRQRGKEWSKIADISRVTIDGKFIYDPEEKEPEYDAEEESEDYSEEGESEDSTEEQNLED